jgi:hypothetical protein
MYKELVNAIIQVGFSGKNTLMLVEVIDGQSFLSRPVECMKPSH